MGLLRQLVLGEECVIQVIVSNHLESEISRIDLLANLVKTPTHLHRN